MSSTGCCCSEPGRICGPGRGRGLIMGRRLPNEGRRGRDVGFNNTVSGKDTFPSSLSSASAIGFRVEVALSGKISSSTVCEVGGGRRLPGPPGPTVQLLFSRGS